MSKLLDTAFFTIKTQQEKGVLMVEIMNKAQECLIKCLRISRMTIAQIIEIVEMLWEEDATLEMLEHLTQAPTLDQAKIYSIACEISQKHKQRKGDR